MSTTELLMPRRITWDAARKKEIEEAKAMIMGFKRQGYEILKGDGTPMERYSPNLEEVVVQPRKIAEHVMKILSDKGDERLVWDKNNGRQAMEAKKKFVELIGKGYKAYSADDKSQKKNRIEEFDVDAQELVMVPPTVKG